MKKLLISLLLVLGLVGCGTSTTGVNKGQESKVEQQVQNTVQIEIVDAEGNSHVGVVEVSEGDVLMDALKANYEVQESDGFIQGIGDVVPNADNKEFLAIYVNDEMAMVGANDLVLTSGDVLKLAVETWE